MSDYKQELFNYMAQDHNVTLLEQDMHEIESIVSKPLKAEIQSLKKGLAEREWVSVETELPPYETEVLVYQPNWKAQLVTTAIYVAQDSSGYRFCFDHNTCMIDQRDFRYSVTHWQPLPPSPDITKGE